jgi:hypothetical protein
MLSRLAFVRSLSVYPYMLESVVSQNTHMQRGRENKVVRKKTTTTTEKLKKSESTSFVSVKSTKVVGA